MGSGWAIKNQNQKKNQTQDATIEENQDFPNSISMRKRKLIYLFFQKCQVRNGTAVDGPLESVRSYKIISFVGMCWSL